MQISVMFYVNVMIVCSLVLAGYANGQSIVVPPSDTTGLVGAHAELSCEVTFGVMQDMRWEHNGAYIYSFTQFGEDYPYGRSKYKVRRNGSTFHLEIKMLTLNDSGIITCHGFIYTAVAVLIVLDNPVLQIEPQDPGEGDSTTITCDASFRGPNKDLISPDHFPELEIYLEGKPLPAATIDNDKNSYNLHKEYNLTLSAHMDGDGITCMIRTAHPAFNATKSRKLIVLYSVRNITYTPQLKQYEVGNNLTCTAQGNPPPVIEWDNTAGYRFQGKQLQITERMVGSNQWKCYAHNNIRGKKHEESMIAAFAVVKDYEITSTVPVDDVSENENNSSIFWIVGLILGIVVLAVGIGAVFIVKKRKQRRSDCAREKGELSNRTTNSYEMMMEGGLHTQSQDTNVTQDSEVDYNRSNESEDATEKQALVTPSINANEDVNKHQISNHEEQPLLMSSQDENPENEEDDTIKQTALIKPSTNEDRMAQTGQALLGILEGPIHEQKTGQLDILCQQMQSKDQHQELFRNQKSLLQLIQTVADADNSIKSRTEMLNVLVSGAEYISEDEVFLEWTDEFVFTLIALLENDADPTWIPEDKSKTYKKTAQYEFFGAIQTILFEKSDLYGAIERVIPWFLSKDCNIQIEHYSTVLHALVNTDWEDLNSKAENVFLNFFKYYNNIIAEVIQNNPSIVNIQDEFGSTPLQSYIQNLKLKETIIKPMSDVVAKLRSKKNINMKDGEGKTVLHYLIQAFPMFTRNISKVGHNSFLKMIKEITSDENTRIQDKYGNTVLHALAEKYRKGVPRYCGDILYQLVKLWANTMNANVLDTDRNTMLHILAKMYPAKVEKTNMNDYLEIIKHVAALTNTNIQDKEGCTVLHVIGQNYDSQNLCKELFIDLIRALAKGADINIKNNDGDTILHIFANKCANVSDSDAKTLLQLMTFLVEQCKTLAQDGKGRTMLHIMMGNYKATDDQNLLHNIVKVCVFKDDKIVIIQDDQECTALHILAGKFPNEVSTQNSESFLEMIRVLASDININKKDRRGYTAFQVVANNCRKDMTECCKKIFPKLIEILKSPQNINFRDEQGSTMLHIIAKRVFSDPTLGKLILPILPEITSQNVNTADASSFTPYSWILKGKEIYKDREIQAMFIKIEQVFLKRGADTDVSLPEWSDLRYTSIDTSIPYHHSGNTFPATDIDGLTNSIAGLTMTDASEEPPQGL